MPTARFGIDMWSEASERLGVVRACRGTGSRWPDGREASRSLEGRGGESAGVTGRRKWRPRPLKGACGRRCRSRLAGEEDYVRAPDHDDLHRLRAARRVDLQGRRDGLPRGGRADRAAVQAPARPRGLLGRPHGQRLHVKYDAAKLSASAIAAAVADAGMRAWLEHEEPLPAGDARRGDAQALLVASGGCSAPAFSPSGRRCAPWAAVVAVRARRSPRACR